MTDDESPASMGETFGFEAREAIKALRTGEAWLNGFPSKLLFPENRDKWTR